MNEQTIQLINQLAAKLGTTAEHLWAILAKQAAVNAVQSCVWMLVWTIVTIIAWVFVKKFWAKINDEDELGAILIGVGACLITAVALIQVGFTFDNVTTAIFNPEYYSFTRMSELLKPAK